MKSRVLPLLGGSPFEGLYVDEFLDPFWNCMFTLRGGLPLGTISMDFYTYSWIFAFLDLWIFAYPDFWILLASSIHFLKYVPSYLKSAFLPVSTPEMPSFLSLFGCTLESHHCWQSPFILQWIIARLHSQIEKGVEPHCWWTIMGFLLLVIFF